ncbi:hypothetical protein MOD72_12025 [Bacillus haynesii]|uniref:hypothetical protein n=1 Tax=Bacillus haynesii TaxID=1925021 RepID=UPI00227F5634|nr:hypothetical protein [Bacillus haynesii]MCY8609904.1 hypothetical protein [Bacillus haynesii]
MTRVYGTLFEYYCDDCEERTFLEKPAYTSDIYCPFCGNQSLAMDSDDYKIMEEMMKEAAE